MESFTILKSIFIYSLVPTHFQRKCFFFIYRNCTVCSLLSTFNWKNFTSIRKLLNNERIFTSVFILYSFSVVSWLHLLICITITIKTLWRCKSGVLTCSIISCGVHLFYGSSEFIRLSAYIYTVCTEAIKSVFLSVLCVQLKVKILFLYILNDAEKMHTIMVL